MYCTQYCENIKSDVAFNSTNLCYLFNICHEIKYFVIKILCHGIQYLFVIVIETEPIVFISFFRKFYLHK